MGLRYYAESKHHRKKFHGWKVHYKVHGSTYKKEFSAVPPNASIPADVWMKYQKTQAELFAAKMETKLAAFSYCELLRKDAPGTKPYRGLGIHGITLGIGSTFDESKTHCFFAVAVGKQTFRVSITEDKPLTKAWEMAVDVWGEEHVIRQKDIDRKKRQVPSPEKFKMLRRYMNDEERAHIPVFVLSEVYREYRDERLWIEAGSNPNAEEKELLALRRSVEKDIADQQKQPKKKFSLHELNQQLRNQLASV